MCALVKITPFLSIIIPLPDIGLKYPEFSVVHKILTSDSLADLFIVSKEIISFTGISCFVSSVFVGMTSRSCIDVSIFVTISLSVIIFSF